LRLYDFGVAIWCGHIWLCFDQTAILLGFHVWHWLCKEHMAHATQTQSKGDGDEF
jgi:hypothetical protein